MKHVPLLLLWLLGLCSPVPAQAAEAPQGATAPPPAPLLRGEYLSKIGGCASCHTAPNGGKAFAGGRALHSPMGTIYSTNITPDPVRGIGGYTLQEFDDAVRKGRSKTRTDLYPAMPYPSYSSMSNEDLNALYLFFMNKVQPVNFTPPANSVLFPFSMRWTLKVWKMLYMPGPKASASPSGNERWSRGAYLTQTIGHCGACHTPRGAGYQERGYDHTSSAFLTGQVNEHWYASNLTGDEGAGIGRIDGAKLSAFLRSGNAGGLAAFGSMAEEVEQSLQYLSEPDADAMAHYLKSLPAARKTGGYSTQRNATKTLAQGNRAASVPSIGSAVYKGFCAQCHQLDGAGIAGVYPRLAGNPAVLSDDATSLIRIVLEGGKSPATGSGPPPQHMPGYRATLTDAQMAEVLDYVRQAWGNDARAVSTSDVSSLRKLLHPPPK